MEIKNNLATLNELILQSKKDGYYFKGYDVQLQEIINIINYSDGFKSYLIKNNEEYNYSYYIFGVLVNYINICYKNNNILEIEKIFCYLEIMSKKQNQLILDLLNIGTLELLSNLDDYKNTLPKIVDLMPNNLKNNFMKNYSEYLD